MLYTYAYPVMHIHFSIKTESFNGVMCITFFKNADCYAHTKAIFVTVANLGYTGLHFGLHLKSYIIYSFFLFGACFMCKKLKCNRVTEK